MKKLSVPIELIDYCTANKLRKPLALYLSLKIASSGKFKAIYGFINASAAKVGIDDKRTLKKHLNALLKLNWIGHNPRSGYYFVRSFEKIRTSLNLKKRTGAVLTSRKLPHFQSWFDSVLISDKIRRQKYYWEKGPSRFKRIVLTKEDSASPIQRVDKSSKPPYYGLSNAKIAEILGCSISQACKRKRNATSLKYLNCKPHYKVIKTLYKADFRIRDYIQQQFPFYKGKLRFTASIEKDIPVIHLLLQQHDEIIPKTVFTRRKSIILKKQGRNNSFSS